MASRNCLDWFSKFSVIVFISALKFVISGALDLLVVQGASFSMEPLLALVALTPLYTVLLLFGVFILSLAKAFPGVWPGVVGATEPCGVSGYLLVSP